MNITPVKINDNKNTNFTARKIAVAQNVIQNKVTNIEIFELNHRYDDYFLKKLGKRVDFNKLFSKYTTEQKDRIQKIFKYCISEGQNPFKKALIAVNEGKICGISTYYTDNNMYIDGLCSIPTKLNTKVNLVGKTFFYILFNKAQNDRIKSIDLDAVLDSPINLVKKYSELGFKDYGYQNGYERMRCHKHSIWEQIKLLGQEIKCEYVQDKTNYNLSEYL